MDKLLHMGEGRILRRLKTVSEQVNLIEPDFVAMTDEELRGQTGELRRRIDNGETLDSIMPEAFATVREAAKRVMDKRHYDVQIEGGAALHWGNIAEMKTGEGKTLVSTLPVYLNALSGKGVHVVTVNDYLARRDAEWMGRVHQWLGLSVGTILANMDPAERRKAYRNDITYGTNNEFGFDYLRDNMALTLDACVQRGHHFAIVDEVDSILVDEARTPLIISGPAEENRQWYPVFATLVGRKLVLDRDYEVDEKKRTVSILEPGIDRVEDELGITNLYESANTPLISYLNNAIRAKELFKKDRDYVVINGDVLIVDEHTGRTLAGRRYNEGLHQAIEAKEGVEVRDEYQTLATITLQNYFRMYDKLAGMTGTAKTEESEFQKIYGLSVIPIATNRPLVRMDEKDLIYRTEKAKFLAIVKEVVERHEKGQPVLIGTASVAKSEVLSTLLHQVGVRHEVLNAKNHEREAAIVAEAGRKGAVTVATNMAGRGTDIILGGNPEFLADKSLQDRGIDPLENSEEYEAAYPEVLAHYEELGRTEHEEVVALGGLYVLGSERHESRRIDNQLRGRSGRQGDPGESRFYLSLEDDLMRLFKSDIVDWVMQALKIPDDQPIENKRVSKSIQQAQEQVESQNFEMRKNVLRYDDVMNRQRHAIYGDRRKVLEGVDVSQQLRDATDQVVEGYVRETTATGFSEDWDLDALWAQVGTLYPVSLDIEEYRGLNLTTDELVQDFQADAQKAYDAREESLGEENMRELERRVLLTVLDRKWREHLYEMDYLREGIGLRAMAQRDPLIEYQREGAEMFKQMMSAFMEEVVGYLFNLEVTVTEQPRVGIVRNAQGQPIVIGAATGQDQDGSGQAANESGLAQDEAEPVTDSTVESPEVGSSEAESREAEPQVAEAHAPAPEFRAPGLESAGRIPLTYTAPDEGGAAQQSADVRAQVRATDPYAGVGRNEQCPCGSGKKFKYCHGRKA
ncbi:preprotein translocase subunit SecA [Raineyella antarctica]|uniref:preprotein translocase subunit SecA n=1 Tax=Raineyella antarctica TaxID=1577474 RepID=UPI000B85BD82|nr:preprotein translocase subunit SecA [Raineyella antarctica]